MLLKRMTASRAGVKIEMRRTKRGNLVRVYEMINGEYVLCRESRPKCLASASNMVEQECREFEGYGARFDKVYMK